MLALNSSKFNDSLSKTIFLLFFLSFFFYDPEYSSLNWRGNQLGARRCEMLNCCPQPPAKLLGMRIGQKQNFSFKDNT